MLPDKKTLEALLKEHEDHDPNGDFKEFIQKKIDKLEWTITNERQKVFKRGAREIIYLFCI